MPSQDPPLPLYQRVKQELLAAIAAGDYSPNRPFITQREICERFGVSHATAVRALNDLAAEGYVVRRRGQGTFVADRPAVAAPSRSRTVACVVQNFGPHVSELLAGVEAAGAALGYRLYLTHCEDDTAREERALLAALDHGATGIIAYPAEGSATVAAYAEVRRRGVPLIMVDRYRPDLATDAVVADNFAAGRDLTAELIAVGHRVIATLWDETDTTSVRDRLAGHIQALRDAGIPLRPDLTKLRPFRQPPAQRRAMLRQLLSGPQPPTVFLCANGYALATAAQDLVALGLSIPGDVDLAGMDDAGPFDLLPLTVAAVVLPSREMGQRAMRLLHDRVLAGDRPPANPEMIVLPIAVRTRKSAPGHLQVVGTPRAVRAP